MIEPPCITCGNYHIGARCPSTLKPTALDTQIGGSHYKKFGKYQPWEVLEKWLSPEELRGYFKGTAISYLARERGKGGDVDIEKAIHTLQGYLALQRKEEGNEL